MSSAVELIERNKKNIANLKETNAKMNVRPSDLPKEKDPYLKLKADICWFLEHRFTILVGTLFTIWALFSDDIRLVGTDKNADVGFDAVISIIFFWFIIEIFLTSFARNDYLVLPDTWHRKVNEDLDDSILRRINIGSFYYWLDWIATLSLILNVRICFSPTQTYLFSIFSHFPHFLIPPLIFLPSSPPLSFSHPLFIYL